MAKKIILVIVILLIIIQFIHPKKNISAAPEPNNIAMKYPVPANVQLILQKACYDCHSNNTRYPWYNNIQPVAWWLNHHINEGKRELNFSEFLSYTPKRQAHKMKEAAEQVEKGGIPLNSYTWIHKDAISTPQEKEAFVNWAKGIQSQIEQANNLQ